MQENAPAHARTSTSSALSLLHLFTPCLDWPHQNLQCIELPEDDVKRVQQLITAGHGGGGGSFGGKPWLAEIVANGR